MSMLKAFILGKEVNFLSKEKRMESFKRVEELINSRKTTAYAVAKELGFSQVVFSDWKSGKSMPKTDKLVKIANFFNVPVTDFIEV